MKLLLEMIMLQESGSVNIANGGNTTISIKNSEGEEIDTIHSFNKIMDRFLEREVFAKNNRLTEEVKAWYSKNFWNWLKRGGTGIQNEEDLALGARYYEPVNDYIDQLISHQGGDITREEVVSQFPEYVQKDLDNGVIFSGGRLFRLNKLIPTIAHLTDYLLANQAAAANPARANDYLPRELFIGTKFTGVQPVDALANSVQWTRWIEANKEKVTRAQMLDAINSLKQDVDFSIDMKFPDGCVAVRILSSNGTTVEGKIMAHCVASYGHSVERGDTRIYSIRNSEGLSRCTIEWDEPSKTAKQIKGPHDSTVPASVALWTKVWMVEHRCKNAGDLHLLQVKSVQQVYDDVAKAKEEGKL